MLHHVMRQPDASSLTLQIPFDSNLTSNGILTVLGAAVD